MKERLQKLISAAGLCSRRRAEEWIVRGKVTVNGGLARLGDSADPETDLILVDGKPLPAAPAQTVTVLLYKPRGVVTTLDDERGRRTVADLLPPELGRLYPVGRLDHLLTQMIVCSANRAAHPADKSRTLQNGGWAGRLSALQSSSRPVSMSRIPVPDP